MVNGRLYDPATLNETGGEGAEAVKVTGGSEIPARMGHV